MARPRELQRLHIPPSLQHQQPSNYEAGGVGSAAGLYSPALPTSIQQGFHPPFPFNGPVMQTPMQPFFPGQPGAPSRPHHQAHHSIAHLAAAGIHPPNGLPPITPHGGHFPRPSMMLGPSGGPPFMNRNRRQPSIGGPPKAALGGPGRKHSPLPVAAATPPVAPPVKTKKMVVNLPKETVEKEDGSVERASWARIGAQASYEGDDVDVQPPELATRESYPVDAWRRNIPDTLDVFLPGKAAWEEMKRQIIEEKLEKLGIEPVQAGAQLHAPHARAASISSPADPALLFFKLNKLQQSQATSHPNSLSSSPQPLHNLDHSPGGPLYATSRHGHSLSLAQPPTYQTTPGGSSNLFSGSSFAPAGESSSPGSLYSSTGPSNIFAPQGRVPLNVPNSRPESRPNFIRGFGLDIPEEEEPDEGEAEAAADAPAQPEEDEVEKENAEEVQQPAPAPEQPYETFEGEDTAEVLSRIHSRHVSRLSASLHQQQQQQQQTDVATQEALDVDDSYPPPISTSEADDGVDEWTATEDQYDGSDDESIGEWSNPSDEERARQQRVQKRMRQRNASSSENAPRRLPNFPYPPIASYDPLRAVEPSGIEDDFISNPSEEEGHDGKSAPQYLHVQPDDYHVPESALSSGKTPRPLPPLPSLPHSRGPSMHNPQHDPSSAHSRTDSWQRKTEALNPNAKPFVFGGARGGTSWSSTSEAPSPAPFIAGHSRPPSIGGTLSAAAPEFKPSFINNFTFRPPAGVPKMPTLIPTPALQPLPEASVENTPARAQQGREKRQKMSSIGSAIEEGDSMLSFQFPMKLESPAQVRLAEKSRSPRLSPSRKSSLNPDAPIFTFPKQPPQIIHSSPENVILQLPASDEDEDDEDDQVSEDDNDENISPLEVSTELNEKPAKRRPLADLMISPTKARSVSMHMDFRHPVSHNTVPAGLFKALVNGEERTRRTVRSRLSSREIFENIRPPSLDDIDVPAISRQVSRQHLVTTDPGPRPPSSEDVFGQYHTRRRSSLPNQPIRSPTNSMSSHMSIAAAADLTGRFELDKYESKLEGILDRQLAGIRHDLAVVLKAQAGKSTDEAAIAEVISLFRTQLLQSASRGLEDSHMDARGDLDLELFKDIVNESQTETRQLIKDDLKSMLSKSNSREEASPIASQTEALHARIMDSVSHLVNQMSGRLDLMTGQGIAEHIGGMLVNDLQPVLLGLQGERFDYEYLTAQLSQAVKPHISQLIDLASDKAETAGLIVDRLIPLLPGAMPPIDTDSLTMQLVSEVRRAIAPIDAFEIKEQVADLVVERLDSRLAIRDNLFNTDALASKLTHAIEGVARDSKSLDPVVETIASEQKALAEQFSTFSSSQKETTELLYQLPSQLEATSEKATQEMKSLLARLSAAVESNDGLSKLSDGLKPVLGSIPELSSAQNVITERLEALPSFISSTTEILQHIQTEMALSVRTAQRETEELRRANAEHQIQLAKARSSHGQVRVDKDRLEERVREAEAEKDRMKARIRTLEDDLEAKKLENVALDAKSSKQEDGLLQALSRLQTSDVDKQSSRSQITELETAKRELQAEKETLKGQVDTLQMDVMFATRDKDTASEALAALQKRFDDLAAQSSHWDMIKKTSTQVEKLTSLLNQTDSQEIKELRRVRDNSKVLEGENSALQKRVQELEKKLNNLEKSSSTARQNLTQAQQRTQQKNTELEKKNKDLEGRVEALQTEVEQWEQTHAQLETDYNTVKQQVEDNESQGRIMQEREANLQQQINTLESKNKVLQTDLINANHKNAAILSKPATNGTNGRKSAHNRPDSRASTVLVDYPNGRAESPDTTGTMTPPADKSVWDSIHAPRSSQKPPSYQPRAPVNTNGARSRYPNYGQLVAPRPARPGSQGAFRRNAPSPAPSVVSVAPTLGDDGWYS